MSLPWGSLVAESPRFEQFVSGGAVVSGTDWIADSVAAGAEQFQLPPKQLAQLWWYSFGGGVVAPSVHLMVGFDAVPSLSFDAGELRCSGFWTGFSTSVSAPSVAEAGACLAESTAPLIDLLCSEFSLRPAPLVSLMVDALRQSALEAGNEHFSPALGVSVARDLVAGFAGPAGSYFGVLDGEVVSLADAEATDDMFVFAPRQSCCMVYRSPGSGLCTSCPKRPAEKRVQDMIALADSFAW
ncbi:(2Fe-2S)-binding protein [Corynebacterium hindlerae]|uniref:(2Fe-2S)-binding protein n=1 Tax=Corynebacterium hindlerae TaxID=699041 RepID=A0A7G5FEJ7_9CORY|nr:(2Fe-2S)-binding protein [Corynebacterium hindlerae]QMV85038.1 (2Fe-2S)-binding protein [Corynebacterium hindlerae]